MKAVRHNPVTVGVIWLRPETSIAESPYKAPSSDVAAPTRWRILPAATLTFFGGCLAVMSPLNLAIYFAGFSHEPSTVSSPAKFVTGLVMMTIAGIAAIATGRLWWQCRWRWAIVSTLVSYGLGVLAASLAWPESF